MYMYLYIGLCPRFLGSRDLESVSLHEQAWEKQRVLPSTDAYVRVVNFAPDKSMQIATRNRHVLGLSDDA